jgi:hypothetical protein
MPPGLGSRASVRDAHHCADGIPSAPRWRIARTRAPQEDAHLLTATKDIDISEAAVLANSCCSADGFGRIIEVSV